MTQLLKRIRNGVAQFVAWLVFKLPFLEPTFISLGKSFGHGPAMESFYREARLRFCDYLKWNGKDVRTLAFGSVEPRFSVLLFTTHDYYFRGLPYEADTTQLILERLTPGSIFIDIGGNHGFFATIAGLRVKPAGRVYSFEPNPAVYAQMEKNIELNDLGNIVQPQRIALSNTDGGSVKLFVSQDRYNTGLSSIILHSEKVEGGQLAESEYVEAPCRTFDSWSAEKKLGRIALMKIDVEGAEELVLGGMGRTLRENPPGAIILETTETSDAYKLLVNSGYSARHLDRAGDAWSNYLFVRKG